MEIIHIVFLVVVGEGGWRGEGGGGGGGGVRRQSQRLVSHWTSM